MKANVNNVPLAVGFGITNREHFVTVSKFAEGVVIGSGSSLVGFFCGMPIH